MSFVSYVGGKSIFLSIFLTLACSYNISKTLPIEMFLYCLAQSCPFLISGHCVECCLLLYAHKWV